MTTKKLHVTHIHASSENDGDRALLFAALALMEQDVNGVTDVCTTPESHYLVKEKLELPAITNPVGFYQTAHAIAKSDAVFHGGGDVITASKMIIPLAMAAILKTPVYSVGVGVNLKHLTKVGKVYLKLAQKGTKKVYVRDVQSQKRLRDLGYTDEQIVQVSDMVFSVTDLTTYDKYDTDITTRYQHGKPYIVVSVRSPEYNSATWGDKEYEQLALALDQLIETHNVDVVLLPMTRASLEQSTRLGDDTADESIMRSLKSNMKNESRVTLLSDKLAITNIIEILQASKLNICCRLHSMILSTIARTPFIGLSYNLKTDGYLSDTNLDELKLNINNLSADSLVNLANDIIANEANVSQKVNLAMDDMTERAKPYATLSQHLSTNPSKNTLKLLDPRLAALFLLRSFYKAYTILRKIR